MSQLDSNLPAEERTRTIVPAVVLLLALLSVLLMPLRAPRRPVARASILCEGITVGVSRLEKDAFLVAPADMTCTPLMGRADDSPLRAVVLVEGREVLKCVTAAAGEICVQREPIKVRRGAEIRMRLLAE